MRIINKRCEICGEMIQRQYLRKYCFRHRSNLPNHPKHKYFGKWKGKKFLDEWDKEFNLI